MNYKCIDGAFEPSTGLNGAISANTNFTCFIGDCDNDEVINVEITHFFTDKKLKEELKEDIKNDFFFDEKGAIAAAYDFSNLKEDEKEKVIKNILILKKSMYPDYEFTILPGKFPISPIGSGGFSTAYKLGLTVSREIAVMSSHILYITNYKKHLQSEKNNESKKIKKL